MSGEMSIMFDSAMRLSAPQSDRFWPAHAQCCWLLQLAVFALGQRAKRQAIFGYDRSRFHASSYARTGPFSGQSFGLDALPGQRPNIPERDPELITRITDRRL